LCLWLDVNLMVQRSRASQQSWPAPVAVAVVGPYPYICHAHAHARARCTHGQHQHAHAQRREVRGVLRAAGEPQPPCVTRHHHTPHTQTHTARKTTAVRHHRRHTNRSRPRRLIPQPHRRRRALCIHVKPVVRVLIHRMVKGYPLTQAPPSGTRSCGRGLVLDSALSQGMPPIRW